MIESIGYLNLLPRIIIVAIGTRTPKLTVMLIFVAIGTLGKCYIAKLLKLLTISRGFFVALNTIYIKVRAFKRIVSITVIKS